VGASPRAGSFGCTTLAQTLAGRFAGPIYPVNPNQREISGLKCYPSLEDLPKPADLVILAVANARLEEQMRLAVKTGCRAATIFASAYMEGDKPPLLTERLRLICREARMPLCGGNCMGFYHPAKAVNAGWYAAGKLEPGPIGLISHSGSLFLSLAANDPRVAYSLFVSPGQELVVTAADFMHYMLEDEETRTIALFLETVRDPQSFSAALEKAIARDVPVVAIKIGKTAETTRLAISHSGAITGNDAAYEALFEKYGVLRARTVDELMATATLMSSKKRVKGGGGVAAVLDSGGARGLFIDLAAELGVPIARINAATEQRLRNRLEFGLDPVNPVDAWGTGQDAQGVFRDCLQAVVDDPAAAIGVLMTDVSNVDTSSELLGLKLPAPILIAPTGGKNLVIPNAESTVAKAATATKTLFCTGSGAERAEQDEGWQGHGRCANGPVSARDGVGVGRADAAQQHDRLHGDLRRAPATHLPFLPPFRPPCWSKRRTCSDCAKKRLPFPTSAHHSRCKSAASFCLYSPPPGRNFI